MFKALILSILVLHQWKGFEVESSQIKIGIDVDKILSTVDEKFLSLALDSSLAERHWKNFDFGSDRFLNMARALSPSFLRLGGTAADFAIFKQNCSRAETNSSSDYTEESGPPRSNFTLCGDDLIRINRFSQSANLTFLFDFNVMLRKSDGSWDESNAKKILEFCSAQGFAGLAWELGNEPNSLQRHFPIGLDGFQLGKDFYRLKKLLSRFPLYKNSILVGPDINHVSVCSFWMTFIDATPFLAPLRDWLLSNCKALKYLQKVHLGSRGVLDAFTWHHYYLNGHTATLKDFLNPQIISELENQLTSFSRFLKKNNMDHIPVWLGETASAYGGGTPGLSDRFVSSFLWLNKLGLTAAHNYQVVIRQTFFNGKYALVGDDGFPNPDFWTSAIYKKLVSNRILKVITEGPLPRSLYFYSHCTNEKFSQTSDVTVFAINMSNQSVTFELEEPLNRTMIQHFYLKPKDGNLTERGILLNDQLLELSPNDEIPDFKPMVTDPSETLTIPPFQMAFWVFVEPKIASLCDFK